MPPLLFSLLLSLFSLSSSLPLSPPSDPISTDEISLIAFKRAVSVDASSLLADWNPGAKPHCQWHAVACDAAGRVTAVNLTLMPSISPLAGTLTPEIANLTALRFFSLKGHNFSGEIPDRIINLKYLEVLDLSFNSLSGAIPGDLIGMSVLESVDLSFNRLSGGITVNPLSSCEFLKDFRVSGNFLVDRIPPEIGNCWNLRTLKLDRNILEGRIPAEIGRISGLQMLDVSRNSLTERIPREIGGCRNLKALILTDLGSNSEEFNAFLGGIPVGIMAIPGLEVLWAPRSNLDGRLPGFREGSCRLRVLNLGENYIGGEIPEWLGNCKNLSFLDLSSNYFEGSIPKKLGLHCLDYFNVSRNSLSGSISGLYEVNCPRDSVLEVVHDFSWNNFGGSLPEFSLPVGRNYSYSLFLNNNRFNGSLSGDFFRLCEVVSGLAVNLSANQITGEIGMLSNCLHLKSFEAADNQLSGSIPLDIGSLSLLSVLDLRGNKLNGTISDQLGRLKNVERVLLGSNGLSGEIPFQLGEMVSLEALDLSRNSLMGEIPQSLANANNIEVLLLDHNLLSGEIPLAFSKLARLTTLDVSFNNLSGEIPHFWHPISCEFFKSNSLLQPCPDPIAAPPSGLPAQTDSSECSGKFKLKSFVVAAVSSASVIVVVLVVLVIVLVNGRRKLLRPSNLKRRVVVTFSNAPADLNYDCIVRATGNFSIQNLIGTGGFGATYKAELIPGFLVAVKRLSIGRFQGLQQFDAEIRTLGRIRHKNLVTLIGYHMGESDTFLIYNYLPGGNLEAFIRNMLNRNVGWLVIHKIALDVAQALAYLHYSCVPRIVHRDIKPSNILLDEKLNAYLSDFGLARLLEVSETHATTDVAGTFGYVAPEYATTCRVSHKADVYSFGVVLLELMSGKRSLDPSFSEYGNGFTIVAWGRLLVQEGRAGEFFCPWIWEGGPRDSLIRMLRLALACTVESLSVRPLMKQVVETLKQLKN